MYDALQAAGAAYGLRPVGLKALASLRMEKGYRDFGHDIDNTDCPLEAGLGFALALDKPGGFVGRDAVLARKAANAAAGGMGQRLVQVRVLDPEPLLFHAEVVHRDGVAGRLRPGGVVRLDARRRRSAWPWSPAAASRSPPDWLAAGTWEVDVAGVRHPVEVSLRPMYDPTSARIRV